MTVAFAKQGYYTQTINFYTGKKPDEKNSAIQNNLAVVLRKIEPLPTLIKFDNFLDYNIKDNIKSICSLANLGKGKISSDTYKLADTVEGKHLYLDFGRNEKGEIILGKENARGTNAPAPQTYILRFVSSNPEDGLITIKDGSISDIRDLTEAPLKGYTKKAYEIKYPLDENPYFYIKCGKFYGKGKIVNLGALTGEFKHEFDLLLLVLFNKESGNRNVRSEQK